MSDHKLNVGYSEPVVGATLPPSGNTPVAQVMPVADRAYEDVALSTQGPLPRSGVLKSGSVGYIEVTEVGHEVDCFGDTCTITPLGYRLWRLFSPCVPCI